MKGVSLVPLVKLKELVITLSVILACLERNREG